MDGHHEIPSPPPLPNPLILTRTPIPSRTPTPTPIPMALIKRQTNLQLIFQRGNYRKRVMSSSGKSHYMPKGSFRTPSLSFFFPFSSLFPCYSFLYLLFLSYVSLGDCLISVGCFFFTFLLMLLSC